MSNQASDQEAFIAGWNAALAYSYQTAFTEGFQSELPSSSTISALDNPVTWPNGAGNRVQDPCFHAVQNSQTLTGLGDAGLASNGDFVLSNQYNYLLPDSHANNYGSGLGVNYSYVPDTTTLVNASASASALPLLGAAVYPAVTTVPTHGTNLNQCPYGCTRTFSRPVEYRRHMKKHTDADHEHRCSQPDCGKRFYRKDKLRDHLWQKHRIETRAARIAGQSQQAE